MCLAVPAEIVELDQAKAVVDVEGVRREVNVAFIENPQVGDHVLLHAGFAIQKWTDEEVQEYREIMASIQEQAE